MPPRESEPKLPKPRPAHVYSHEQIVKLFGTIRESRKKATKLDELTFRTLLLLLYGTGMRIGEALRLTMAGVDLNEAAGDSAQDQVQQEPDRAALHSVMRSAAFLRRTTHATESSGTDRIEFFWPISTVYLCDTGQ